MTFTVALIGPDGAGKTTVSRRLERELPFPARALYMGVNLDNGGPMLPTTRLLLAFKRLRGRRADLVAATDGDRGVARSRGVKAWARMAFWMSEEVFRLALARYHVLRRRVVIFDRHFYADYYDYDVAPGAARSSANRLHGIFLEHVYARPDLVVCLDAPGELLYARKREATPEWLERRRARYLELAAAFPAHAVVDASRDVDDVVRAVAEHVVRFHAARNNSQPKQTAPAAPTREMV